MINENNNNNVRIIISILCLDQVNIYFYFEGYWSEILAGAGVVRA